MLLYCWFDEPKLLWSLISYLPFVFKETFSKGNKTTNSLHMVSVTLVLMQSQTTIFPNVTAESFFHVYEYNNESTKVQFSVKVLCFANLSIQISPSCPQTLHCWEAFAEILLKTSQFTDRDTVLVEVCYSAPSWNAHRHLFEKFFEPLPKINRTSKLHVVKTGHNSLSVSQSTVLYYSSFWIHWQLPTAPPHPCSWATNHNSPHTYSIKSNKKKMIKRFADFFLLRPFFSWEVLLLWMSVFPTTYNVNKRWGHLAIT